MDKNYSRQHQKKFHFVIGYGMLSIMSICAVFSFPKMPTPVLTEAVEDHAIAEDALEPTPEEFLDINRTDFFVSETGSDRNPGSENKPWKTIQKCAKTLTTGQTCHVLEGYYPEHVTMQKSGAEGSPIIFTAVGKVTMNGFTVRADYITIDGFEITDTEDYWETGWGIFYQGAYGVIQNNYIYYATRGGITVFASSGNETNTHHVAVKNNRLYRNALVGIEIHGRDNLVEGNEIWGTIQHHPKSTEVNGNDADGISFFGSGHVIRKNYIHDILYGIPENINPHIDCFQTWSDAHKEAASNVIIEQNHCVNLQAQSAYEVGQGFMMGNASDIIIRNNLIEAFRGANIIKNSQNILIINNTFIGNPDGALVSFYPNAVGFNHSSSGSVVNNIFYNFISTMINADYQSRIQLTVINNNAYRADGGKLVDLSSYPDNLWDLDPMFVDPYNGNYHLRPDSPLIDRGIDFSTLQPGYSMARDMDDNPRLQGTGCDIGAFEFQPGADG